MGTSFNPIVDGVEGFVKGIGGVLDGLFTSDEERGKIAVAMEEIRNAPFMASLKVLSQEAAHKSIFVAGARPSLLWACVAGLLYEGIIRGLLTWIMQMGIIVSGHSADIMIAAEGVKVAAGVTAIPPLPSIEGVFFELCGLASALYGVRAFEKVKGVATNSLAASK